MEKERKCINCQKILMPREDTDRIRPNRKFCDVKCRTRYNANKRYQRVKGIAEYKEYRRKYMNVYNEKKRVANEKHI